VKSPRVAMLTHTGHCTASYSVLMSALNSPADTKHSGACRAPGWRVVLTAKAHSASSICGRPKVRLRK